MALSQRLDLRQSQALVMTPQLQQAIKLLQLSNQELGEFVEQELEQNPLLERDESDAEPAVGDTANGSAVDSIGPMINGEHTGVDNLTRPGPDLPEVAPPPEGAIATIEGEPLFDGDATESWQATEGAEGAGDQHFAGDLDAWQVRNGSPTYGDDLRGLEQTLGQEITLREHLMQQLMVDIDDPVDRMIGLYLIDLLEPSGYLTANLSEAALQLGCSVDRIEATLARLQRFDPAGIFARSLSECLAIQLAERDRLDPAMPCLLDHLPMLANPEANSLIRLCGVDAEDLAGMVAEIR